MREQTHGDIDMFKTGDKVIWVNDSDADVYQHEIKYGVIASQKNRDECMLVGEKYPRFSAFLYPDIPECVEHLKCGIDLRIKQKQEMDQYMGETYQLNNSLVLRGLK